MKKLILIYLTLSLLFPSNLFCAKPKKRYKNIGASLQAKFLQKTGVVEDVINSYLSLNDLNGHIYNYKISNDCKIVFARENQFENRNKNFSNVKKIIRKGYKVKIFVDIKNNSIKVIHIEEMPK